MENRAHALAAGLFTLLLGAAMVAAVLWFRGDHRERVEHSIVARTGVPGLSLKAPVKLSGVEVGSVEAIGFDPADASQILIRVSVDSNAPLTRGTVAQLGYQGVTGLSFIDLSDRGNDPRPLASAPERERRMVLQPSLLDQLSTAGPALLAGFGETAQRLNTLLDSDNQARVGRLLDSAERSLGQVGERAHELRPTLLALPALLRRLDDAAQRADASLRRIDAAGEAATQLATELRSKLVVLDAAGAAAAGVQSAAQSFEFGLVGSDRMMSTPLLGTLAQTARTADRALVQLSEEPHSLLFGRPLARPGPGEAGFGAMGAGR